MCVIQCCCVFCLVLPVLSGTGVVTKSVCSEDSIVLFENVLDSRDTVNVSIYMNHQTHIIIAEWEVKNLTIMSHIQPGYEEKVYLSKDGSIWLHNVNHGDQEKYFIVYGRDTPDVKYEVEIHVMVAPTTHCKPKITHGDKILIASLEVEDCGTPVVSVQWLDHPGISNTSEPMINLPPGSEAGTYYACLKGPALKCAKISTLSDYCSSYTIRGDVSPPLSSQPTADISHLKTAFLVTTHLVVCCFVILAAHTSIKLYRFWRRHSISEKLTDDQIKEKMQKCLGVYPMLMEKYFEKLTDDQLFEQMQKCIGVYPLLMEKYLVSDQKGSCPTNPPTLEELAVTPKEVDNETDYNQSPLFLSQGKVISPKICGDSSSDKSEDNQEAILRTIVDLGIKRTVKMTEREDNQKQWVSSQKKVLSSETCSSPISGTLNEPYHSVIQPFNKDEQDANPEQDNAQAKSEEFFGVSVKEDSNYVDESDVPLPCDILIQVDRLGMSVKEDSNSDDECKVPLLDIYSDQKPKANM